MTNALMEYLKGRKHVLRVQASRDLGMTVKLVRELASESGGHVLSTNSGYILAENASQEDRREAVGRIRSQALAMMVRAKETLRVVDELQVTEGRTPFQLPLEYSPYKEQVLQEQEGSRLS